MNTLIIDGYHLTSRQVMDALLGRYDTIELSPQAAERCAVSRQQIDRWLEKDAPVVYGVTTGLGSLKDRALSPEEHVSWNRTIPYPHAVGFEPVMDSLFTRAALLIRANVLARGHSAVRPEMIRRMLDIFCAGIAPVVYELGSTGLSDLPSLAQITLTIVGDEHAEAFYQGVRRPSCEALRMAGLPETFVLQCKEALAQMNGSSATQALAAYAVCVLEQLLLLQRALPDGCANSQVFLADIGVTLQYIRETVDMECNVSCDNPLLFPTEDGGYEAVMGCNCSNTQVGYCMDMIPLLCCELVTVLTLASVATSVTKGMLADLRALTLPASADSISTKANQEDHVEFSYGAARKAVTALGLYRRALCHHMAALPIESIPEQGGLRKAAQNTATLCERADVLLRCINDFKRLSLDTTAEVSSKLE